MVRQQADEDTEKISAIEDPDGTDGPDGEGKVAVGDECESTRGASLEHELAKPTERMKASIIPAWLRCICSAAWLIQTITSVGIRSAGSRSSQLSPSQLAACAYSDAASSRRGLQRGPFTARDAFAAPPTHTHLVRCPVQMRCGLPGLEHCICTVGVLPCVSALFVVCVCAGAYADRCVRPHL